MIPLRSANHLIFSSSTLISSQQDGIIWGRDPWGRWTEGGFDGAGGGEFGGEGQHRGVVDWGYSTFTQPPIPPPSDRITQRELVEFQYSILPSQKSNHVHGGRDRGCTHLFKSIVCSYHMGKERLAEELRYPCVCIIRLAEHNHVIELSLITTRSFALDGGEREL
ncbi:uncharacterized protein BO95DRAFT_130930 [Aspergillus brunneoviolaceus CBS 621.78]|uniref:Uncharacterized protein n=1 Tax=Aspergillus brunneoviolaceus CBS 621.78 TaxID=1450534 RepID=A0ACD1G8S6_9EURO|nr:hypothetical protein BO95DRAFT_130930 [Aspergillus brunneoviolaceus CBS 621.78]RAH45651.1 hypothetical protein BO95DRAFT_130930 [Aspergillus brunneoviolaceus CBS 621.78]